MTTHAIAVIGAGASGTLLALHLLRRAPPGTRITLIDRNAPFGPGLAYATGSASHLLNVPAGRMSAFVDQPRHFVDWLERQSAQLLGGIQPTEASFLPRRLYGAYLRLCSIGARHGRAASSARRRRHGAACRTRGELLGSLHRRDAQRRSVAPSAAA
jgi:uncharacterized NAD(P)/FAD-binding protein YdhS